MTIIIHTYTLLASIAFKVAFTAADAPELIEGVLLVEWIRSLMSGYTLATLARSVYLAISISSLMPIAISRMSNSSRHQIRGKFVVYRS